MTGDIAALTNSDRAANGLGALGWDGNLGSIAQNWANWMAANGQLVHQNLNAIIGGTGYHTLGENILVGPGNISAAQMEAAWMNSAPHRANILNGTFTAIGVGVAVSADGRIWSAVEFGG
jgi:uncharacterized protein YkwD